MKTHCCAWKRCRLGRESYFYSLPPLRDVPPDPLTFLAHSLLPFQSTLAAADSTSSLPGPTNGCWATRRFSMEHWIHSPPADAAHTPSPNRLCPLIQTCSGWCPTTEGEYYWAARQNVLPTTPSYSSLACSSGLHDPIPPPECKHKLYRSRIFINLIPVLLPPSQLGLL